ncbi:MAG TPA: AAA family ATPase, partial [Solirubrobacteraceae bacterium]
DQDPPPAPAPAPPPTPAPRTAGPELVERDRELRQLGALLAEAAAGEGRVALIEGPAGVGKTRLLAEARRRAARADTVVLYARAGEVERDFPFGVVRQLLEEPLADPERRRALLSGAAAPAAAVFGAMGDEDAADAGGAADAGFAVLHGLFWVALNLAADRPLMLAVDDLHWCDRPSLRFLAYLVRRLEGLPVLVAVTLRTGEQPADATLLDEILHDPATVPVRPGPLSLAAVRVVVRARLGNEAAEAFCAACHETTGGNPLLLRQLLAALEADGVEPLQDSVPIVREIGPRAVSRSIALRLGRLSPDTVAVARAIAVLGEGAKLPVVAALAELPVEDAAHAVGRLAQAEVLRAEPPLGFVHPLVRDAVYLALPVGERELRHATAARVLAETGAPPDEAAVHLLAAPPRGDAWAAETLLAAGRAAARRGAADGAVAYLRRALAEPPPPALRPELLLELGITEQAADGPAAVEHLRAAYDESTDPEARGRAAFALGWTMFFVTSPPETIEFAQRASAELPPELADLAYALEAVEFVARLAWGFFRDDVARLRGRREAPPPGDGPGAKMLTAITAFDWAIDGGPLDRCVALSRAALEGGDLIAHDNGLFIPAVASVLSWADHPEALAVWDAALAEAHRRGSLFLTLTVHLWRARTLYVHGELAEAEDSLREGIDELALWGSGAAVQGYPAAFLGHVLLERVSIEEARTILDQAAAPVGSDPDALVAIARADVFLAEGRPRAALAALEPLASAFERHHQPAWMPWRSTLGRALAGVGRGEEAVGLLDAEVDLARRWGAPATLGRALRIRATLPGAEDLELLRAAVKVLEPSHARLERAHALAALGAALHARGADPEARPPLQQALDLAEACGALPLAEACRAGLQAAGAAPRAATRAGVAALTQLERRVAALASTGDDPRAIAQAIFLTPREAEAHLDAARRKLGVEDPADLGRALAGAGV